MRSDLFDAVLYAHSKGVSDLNRWTEVWRRSMPWPWCTTDGTA
jgi:hypothetical protein